MKDNMTKVREALGAAYRNKKTVHTGEFWETRVMGHIQNLGAPASPASFSALFGRFVWRTAPVVCILIIALTVGLLTLEYTPEYDITATFMTDPIESTVEQLWEG